MSSPDQPDFSGRSLGPINDSSRLEWQSIIGNNGVTPTSWLNPLHPEIWGKFFPRQMRGFIESIEVYIHDTTGAGGWLVLGISPQPIMGTTEVHTLIIPPGSPDGWYGVDFNYFWNYDALFIEIYSVDANITFGAELGKPWDAWRSLDGGHSWTSQNGRIWIRVVYKGETCGDVPVSGTVNAVELPSIGSVYAGGVIAVPNNVETRVAQLTGAGTLIEAKLIFADVTVPAVGVVFGMRIDLDGDVIQHVNNRDLTQSIVATFGRASHGEFYQGDGETVMNVRLALKFRNFFELYAHQTTGAPVNVHGTIVCNLVS